jgi:hypothetical protein
MSSPLLNVASSDSPVCQWIFKSFLWMLPAVATPSAHGHSCVFPSFERCSQRQPYLPMDIHVLPPFSSCSQRQPYLLLDTLVSSLLLSKEDPYASQHFTAALYMACEPRNLLSPLPSWMSGLFFPFGIFAWQWKKDSALSLGLLHRTLPLWGPRWWPLEVPWLVMSFLSR